MRLFRRRLILSTANNSNSPLPSGYIKLSYIESTGKQYINTGIKPSNDMEFEIAYKALSSGQKLFGCEVNGASLFDAFNVKPNSVSIRAFAHSNAGGTVKVISTVAGKKTTLKLVIRNGVNNIYVNDSSIATAPVAGTVPNLSIYLFASNNGRMAGVQISAIIYSFKIHKSGILVGDFMPCINPQGEIGLYDLVTKQFFGNAGTGSFIAGY